MHPRKTITNAIFFLVLLLVSLTGKAQSNYPIYVTPTLTPPYSLKLSDYSAIGSQNLMVSIMVNDLNVADLPVKLQIKMETAGVTIENPPTITTTPIYLNGGANTILFGEDLEDYFKLNNLIFKGYSKDAYRKTGQLPGGFYKFSVEVLHFNTNRLISNVGNSSAWIVLGKPPLLKAPAHQAETGQFVGMPITFSWLESNVGSPGAKGNIQYHFEMWEMRVPGINPNTVVMSIPVFHEHTTFNSLYSLYPATLLMEPGMQYAWRVTASDVSGMVPFEQNGHSEVRTFIYKAKCDNVTNIAAEAKGKNGTFTWDANQNHTSFNIEVQQPQTGWFLNSETFDTNASYFDLEPGQTYQIRVQGVCNGDPQSVSDFSEWKRLTIPEPKPMVNSDECPNCGCDDDMPNVKLTNFELKTVQPGDTIINKTGTTRFIVRSANQQGDRIYNGVFLFWAEIWGCKIVCNYENLQVNTDNVIVNMSFESVYDTKYMVDVVAVTDYANNLADNVSQLTTVTTIRDSLPLDISFDQIIVRNDSVIAVSVTKNGEITEEYIDQSENLDNTLIKGKNGENVVVSGNGQAMGIKEFENTGGNSRLLNNYNKEKEKDLPANTSMVSFTASKNQQYGFDAYTDFKKTIQHYYPALDNGYRPAFKSLPAFGTDKVVPNTTQGVLFKDEMGIKAMANGEELIVRGSFGDAEVPLYAYHMQADSTEQVVGKLQMVSYTPQSKKLYIVQVNGAKMPTAIALQNTLNKIYAQALTSWQVQELQINLVVNFPGGKMTHGGSNNFTTYNADQKTIIAAFEQSDLTFERDACYLFYIDNVQHKDKSIAGYMPLQRPIGFIYDNPNLNIVAHELAHGAFNLYHTFSNNQKVADQFTTENLMDYNGGTELWKHQWDAVHNPERVMFAFMQDESEGAALNTPGLQKLIDRIKKANLQKENYIQFNDYKTKNNAKSIVYLQQTVKLLTDEIPLGAAIHVFSKEELNKLTSSLHEKIDYRTPGVVGNVPGGFTYRMDFEYLDVDAVLNEGNYENPKIALEFFLKKENYERFRKYLSGESTLESLKDYIVYKGDANIREKESPYSSVKPEEFLTKGKAVELISHLTTGNAARALVRYKEDEEEYCTSTSNLMQIIPIEDNELYKLREDMSPFTLPYSDETENEVKASEILYVTKDCGEYKCINKKDDDEYEFLGWVKAKNLKEYVDNSKLGKDEFSQKYLKATETAVDDIIEDWQTNEAACNLCVRAALYNLTGDEVLYPKTGSSTTIKDEGEQLYGKVVSGEGNAQGIIDDLKSGVLDEYFEEITIDKGESYPDFWKRVQAMVDNKEIVIGTYDPGHVFMVVPGGLYEVVDNTDHLVWDKVEKKWVLKNKYKLNPVIEEGDKYGYTFAKNGFDYVLRIMDCGAGAKMSNGPAYALMDRAAMKCEPNRPVVRLYKYIKK